MRSPEEVLGQIADRLRRSWSDVVAGAAWSTDFRLGTSGLTGRRLAESWSDAHRGALRWQEWAATAGEGGSLVTRPATVHGTTQQLPAHLHVATIDDAARLAGEEWVARLARARVRRAVLAAAFPEFDDVPAILRLTDTYGDVDTVAYRPRVVLISENRDTAQLFPSVEGGIAIEGEGRGGGAVASLARVRDADALWYWGDMDADGLEILDGFRAAGLPAQSLFMDLPAYRQWERYGVDHDHRGNPIDHREPRDVPTLEPGERELYLALCSPSWPGTAVSSRNGSRSTRRPPSYGRNKTHPCTPQRRAASRASERATRRSSPMSTRSRGPWAMRTSPGP